MHNPSVCTTLYGPIKIARPLGLHYIPRPLGLHYYHYVSLTRPLDLQYNLARPLDLQ